MKIGVIIESFKIDFKTSLKEAAALGIKGIQCYANSSVIHSFMTKREIAEARRMVEGEGIEFSALCGDFGCKLYYLPGESRKEINEQKRIMEIAQELGTNIVTTHIGVVPDDKNTVQYESMHKVCRELAEFADSVGGHFAVETGPEKSYILKDFLDSLNSRGVAVNLDPANLVMCSGEKAEEAVLNLKDYIVHTHAKDGIQIRKVDTRRLYAPHYFGLEPEKGGAFKELPLGKGDVNFDKYFAALKSIGYDGYLTIEREVGETPSEDIALAVDFLKKYI